MLGGAPHRTRRTLGHRHQRRESFRVPADGLANSDFRLPPAVVAPLADPVQKHHQRPFLGWIVAVRNVYDRRPYLPFRLGGELDKARCHGPMSVFAVKVDIVDAHMNAAGRRRGQYDQRHSPSRGVSHAAAPPALSAPFWTRAHAHRFCRLLLTPRPLPGTPPPSRSRPAESRSTGSARLPAIQSPPIGASVTPRTG